MRKTTRLLALCLNFYSISAVADYQCVLQLKSIVNPDKIVAEKTYIIERSNMRAGSLGELHLESKKRKKKVTFEVNGVMSGWAGEEDAVFVIMRRETTRRSHHIQAFSNKIEVKGNDIGFGSTFDLKYDVEVRCKVTPTSENVGAPID